MIISSLHIDGFGIFHKITLGPLSKALTVLAGGNESGKSTCLAFIRAILFGFPDGRSSDNLYPPLAGGVHGGRLSLLNDSGEEYTIERFAGVKGGLVTITHPDGAVSRQENLSYLLGSANRELFHNVFAFSLGELQRFESLKSEMVRSAMYSAGVGMGRFDLAAFEAALSRAEGDLFKPGGRVPTINVKINRLDDIQKELRSLENNLQAYDLLHEKLVSLNDDIRELREQKISAENKLGGVSRLLDSWEEWVSYYTAKEELVNLEIIDSFPPDGQTGLHNLTNLLNDRMIQLKVLEVKLINLGKKLESYGLDEKLIGQGLDIQQLLKGRDHCESMQQRLPGLRLDFKRITIEMEKLLKTLGPEWSVVRLKDPAGSITLAEEIRAYQSRLHEVQNDQDRLKATQISLAEQAEKAGQVEREIEREVDLIPTIPEPLEENLIQQLSAGRDQYASVVKDFPLLSKELQETKTELVRKVRELDPSWDVSHLESLDCSVTMREEVRNFRDQFQRSRAAFQNQQERYHHSRKEVERTSSVLNEARKGLANLPEPKELDQDVLIKRKTTLRVLSELLARRNLVWSERKALLEKLTDLEQQVNVASKQVKQQTFLLPFWAIPLELMVFLLGALALTWMGRGREGLLMALIGLIIATLLYLIRYYVSRNYEIRRDIIQNHLVTLKDKIRTSNEDREIREAQLAGIDQEISAICAALKLSQVPEVKDILRLEENLERELALLKNWQLACRRKDEVIEQLKHGEEFLKEEETHFLELELQFSEINAGWKKKLQSLQLREVITPESVLEIFAALESCREKLKMVDSLEQRINLMEEAERNYSQLAARLLRRRSMDFHPGELIKAVDKLFSEIHREEKLAKQLDTVKSKLEAASKNREGLSKSLREIEESLLEVNGKHQSWLHQWQEWLLGKGWPSNLSPEGALDFLRLLDKGNELVAESAHLSESISALQFDTEKYAKLVNQVRAACGWSAVSSEATGAATDFLVDRLAQEEEKAREMVLTRKEKENVERDHESLTVEISKIQVEINKFLSEVGAVDEKDFYRRAEIFRRRKSLRTDLAKLEGSIARLTGMTKGIKEIEAKLSESTLYDLSLEKTRLYESVTNIENELKRLYEERARVDEQIRQLSSGERMSELKGYEQTLLEELRVLTRKWSVITVARRLMRDARAFYEQERQPGVIREASNYFKKLTGEKYTSIFAPIEGGDPEVITKDKNRKKLAHLSRGTAEQLYLSLRFGFIKEYGKHSVVLPVIMDDILVNFDSQRALAAARSIVEFSGSQQVLFFTCHEETVTMFQSLDETLPVIRL